MKFEFGMVLTADFLPQTRMMLVAPTKSGFAGQWWAVVLCDETLGDLPNWVPGAMVTLSPDNAGLRIVDTPEGSE